jgi:ketosteroid isomerase-like protein
VNDDQAIRDLVARTLDAVARGDVDAWVRGWHRDGVWVMPGIGEVRGTEALRETFATQRARFELCVQELLFGWVDTDGDRATARWYLRELQRSRRGTGQELLGCYDDDVVRDDGRWGFARRRFWVLYRGPRLLAGDVLRPPPPAAT